MLVQVRFRTITDEWKRCKRMKMILNYYRFKFKILLCSPLCYKMVIKLFVLVYFKKIM